MRNRSHDTFTCDCSPRRHIWRIPELRYWLIILLTFTTVGCEQIASLLPGPLGASPQIQLEGERTVELQVIEGQGGGVLAFIPVFINDQGPYHFALDTGASHTTIDEQIVDQLQLETAGPEGSATGVTGTAAVRPVRLENWRIGDIELPPIIAGSIDLPDPSDQNGNGGLGREEVLSEGLQGLLGSDILSQFGAVTIDYDREALILRPRSQPGG